MEIAILMITYLNITLPRLHDRQIRSKDIVPRVDSEFAQPLQRFLQQPADLPVRRAHSLPQMSLNSLPLRVWKCSRSWQSSGVPRTSGRSRPSSGDFQEGVTPQLPLRRPTMPTRSHCSPSKIRSSRGICVACDWGWQQ